MAHREKDVEKNQTRAGSQDGGKNWVVSHSDLSLNKLLNLNSPFCFRLPCSASILSSQLYSFTYSFIHYSIY